MGGFNLPPGCGTLPGEEPDPCEGCWNIDEDGETCIAGNITSKDFNFDMCPVHRMVDACLHCGKKMKALIGKLPKEYIANNPFEDGPIGCCSEKCAKEQQAKYDKEIEAMRMADMEQDGHYAEEESNAQAQAAIEDEHDAEMAHQHEEFDAPPEE